MMHKLKNNSKEKGMKIQYNNDAIPLYGVQK